MLLCTAAISYRVYQGFRPNLDKSSDMIISESLLTIFEIKNNFLADQSLAQICLSLTLHQRSQVKHLQIPDTHSRIQAYWEEEAFDSLNHRPRKIGRAWLPANCKNIARFENWTFQCFSKWTSFELEKPVHPGFPRSMNQLYHEPFFA